MRRLLRHMDVKGREPLDFFMDRLRLLGLPSVMVGLIATTAGCGSDPLIPGHLRVCPQFDHHSNTGCALVVGQVLGSSGQPLHDVGVGPRYIHSSRYTSTYVKTDSLGRFSFRIMRMGSPPDFAPDTFSLYVRAVIPPGIRRPETISDSVMVQVEVARVGELPRASEATIVLDYP